MFHDFLDLLYPRVCHGCETTLMKNEEVLCTSCLHAIPVLNHHLERDNLVEKIFYGRIPLENATSLLVFEKKGLVQKLIHNLKYRGHEKIGVFLGEWLGKELAGREEWKNISMVIPVPLHKQKLNKRGYNQVSGFGREISKALNIPFQENILLKVNASQTQTLKKRFARWGDLEETLILKEEESLKDSHILIVDDLVTTGATLEACAQKLRKIPGVKISIATMAVTH